ncbi:MAG TPA: hypothetical protein VM598_09940, partial [Bdellovibrionota bacterium]|nr:hypothetical protein [Bdellovibrionota bacterium]
IQLSDRTYTSCHASATGSNGVEAREKALRDCKAEIAEGAKLSATILKASRPAGPGPEPEFDELNLIEEGGT